MLYEATKLCSTGLWNKIVQIAKQIVIYNIYPAKIHVCLLKGHKYTHTHPFKCLKI